MPMRVEISKDGLIFILPERTGEEGTKRRAAVAAPKHDISPSPQVHTREAIRSGVALDRIDRTPTLTESSVVVPI